MVNKLIDCSEKATPKVEQNEHGCKLELSADGNWLRLVVSEKLVASFHVDYAKKILNSINNKNLNSKQNSKPSFPNSEQIF